MIQQRSDLYCVAWFLSPEETAHYQVFINLLIFAQFAGSLLLSPFAKNIFRLPDASFKKMEKNFIVSGILFSLISSISVYVIMTYFYRLPLPVYFFVGGMLYIYLFYLYLPQNYLLGKDNRQVEASVLSLIATTVNLIVGLWLTPSLGIAGAFAASILAQLVLVLTYHRNKFIYAKS